MTPLSEEDVLAMKGVAAEERPDCGEKHRSIVTLFITVWLAVLGAMGVAYAGLARDVVAADSALDARLRLVEQRQAVVLSTLLRVEKTVDDTNTKVTKHMEQESKR